MTKETKTDNIVQCTVLSLTRYSQMRINHSEDSVNTISAIVQ